MCELLGVSCSRSVDVVLSFSELARHGGATGSHVDGWGVAFYEGRDAVVMREPRPAAQSPWVRCLAENPFRSATVVAHVRKATQGDVALCNTQPYQRELFGRVHVFAHNGDVRTVLASQDAGTARFRPIGTTDSEAMFCLFLDRLAVAAKGRPPPFDVAWRLFVEFAAEMAQHGPANMIYSNGSELFAHADRRMQRSGRIEPPGLMLLERHCRPDAESGPPVGVVVEGEVENVALLASVPLSNENWRPLPTGTVVGLAAGRVIQEEAIAPPALVSQ